jgi:hypothetical protein
MLSSLPALAPPLFEIVEQAHELPRQAVVRFENRPKRVAHRPAGVDDGPERTFYVHLRAFSTLSRFVETRWAGAGFWL